MPDPPSWRSESDGEVRHDRCGRQRRIHPDAHRPGTVERFLRLGAQQVRDRWGEVARDGGDVDVAHRRLQGAHEYQKPTAEPVVRSESRPIAPTWPAPPRDG